MYKRMPAGYYYSGLVVDGTIDDNDAHSIWMVLKSEQQQWHPLYELGPYKNY